MFIKNPACQVVPPRLSLIYTKVPLWPLALGNSSSEPSAAFLGCSLINEPSTAQEPFAVILSLGLLKSCGARTSLSRVINFSSDKMGSELGS